MKKSTLGQPRRPPQTRTVWDAVMVVLAVIDLVLIVFDLTYVSQRPLYVEIAPELVRLYDPVKGIRPHPTSQQLVQEAERTRTYLRSLDGQPAAPDVLAMHVRSLREVTLRLMREDPFRGLGQAHQDQLMRQAVGVVTGVDPADLAYPPAQVAAVEALWPADAQVLGQRLAHLDGPVWRAQRINYYRALEPNGKPVSHFARLELPILVIFWLDFWIGWLVFARTHRNRRWYHYPVTHWYDLIGLMPGTLRVFRLFRLGSIYVRIYRGKLEQVRDNAIKRAAERMSEFMVDEVTNRVQVQAVRRLETLLTDEVIQDALSDGLLYNQTKIVELAIDQLEHAVSDPAVQERVRELVAVTADEAGNGRRHLPFARGLTRNVADRATVATFEALQHMLQSERARHSLGQLMLTASESAREQPSFSQLRDLITELALRALQAVGASARERAWALPAAEPLVAAEQQAPSEPPEAIPAPPKPVYDGG